MIFAHAFIGLIIAFFFTPSIVKDTEKQRIWGHTHKLWIWLTAIAFSILPDFDLVYIFLIDSTAKHRHLLSHSIVPYTIVGIITLFVLIYKRSDRFFKYLVIIAYTSITFHLLADAYTAPIYAFLPIINKSFSLQPFPLDINSGLLGYISSPYLTTEIIIIIAGTILLIKSFIKEKKELLILLFSLGMIEISVIIALLPFVYSFN